MHVNQGSGGGVDWRYKVGAVNPRMSASQPRHATVIDGYDWNGIGQCILSEIKDLSYAAGTTRTPSQTY